MDDPSQLNQATYLLKYLNYRSGFFIEAGANDGIVNISEGLKIKK